MRIEMPQLQQPGLIAAFVLAMACLSPWAAVAATLGTQRCGWFDNPTPANASLTDRDTDWTVGVQGGHQAQGDWPRFADRDWVRTGHGSHGYGCACMKVSTDDKEQIMQIFSARSRPLSACRQDPALKAKEPVTPLAAARPAGS
ncbi:hypothetical protein A4F85_06335 [Delftia sp. GW456-R20]|nr:hypothetical protein A4F85_06335 [Delftia sp. GW456-R20]